MSFNENMMRRDLAAAFRWAARLNLHEGIANHFSVAVSDDGKQFLLQPAGTHFSSVRASDLILLNSDDPSELQRQDAPDPTGWFLHAYLHKNLPHAKCVLHVHAQASLTISCLKNFEFMMLDQNACRFYDRIAYDYNYSGMALDKEEGERVASLLENEKTILMMANHGTMVVAPSISQAFDELYYFERACALQVSALQTNKELSIIPDNLAKIVADEWLNYPTKLPYWDMHFNALKKILDKEEADYAL